MKNNIKNLENFNDYLSVFKVFESFPFFEKWTLDEIRKEFDLNSDKGHVFGYYENGLCLGFISIRNQIPNEHPIHYGHESKVLYISDLAVLPQYRHRGIATQLLKYSLEIAISEGYEIAYLRINDNNPMAYEIARKQGFHKVHDACEIIEREHTIHMKNYSEEFRIFMTKSL